MLIWVNNGKHSIIFPFNSIWCQKKHTLGMQVLLNVIFDRQPKMALQSSDVSNKATHLHSRCVSNALHLNANLLIKRCIAYFVWT